MIYLGIDQVLELNQKLDDNGMKVILHMKDRCGGQVFRLEGEEPAVSECLKMITQEIDRLFPGHELEIIYDEEQKSFTIKQQNL